MPLAESLPYGLRDVKVYPITVGATDTVGTGIDLPNSQTLSFEESEDFEELRGDDKIVAKRGKGPAVAWTLESGGIMFEALAIINGGTVLTTGTTPSQKKTYAKKSTDPRPYFQVEGQAMSESGGDFHTVIYKCKADGKIGGELGDGSFWVTQCDGSAIGRKSDDTIYLMTQNETAAAVTTTAAV